MGARHLTYHYFPEPPPRRRAEPKPRAIDHRPACPRQALATQAMKRGLSLAELSHMIDRHESYLSRFVREGVPMCLSEREHRLLADVMGLDERGLGVRTLWGQP